MGPWLARVAVRLAARDDAARPGPAAASASMTVVLRRACSPAPCELTGLRPATAALAWAAGAAVVLGGGGPGRPPAARPGHLSRPSPSARAALLVDAAVLGTWGALLRAVARRGGGRSSSAAGAAGASRRRASGFGDVKLLGLLGLVLGWFGWGVLLAGVFLGLLTGALVSLVLLATRRAGWRTAMPFGPPLLAGAVLALALAGRAPRGVGGGGPVLAESRAMLRWLTAGESHGQQLTAILEGLPAGVEVQTTDIDPQLARRRLGHGRGARMSFEQDEVTLTGGVRHGRTQGGPIAIQVGNTEWPKWSTVMSADPVDPEVLGRPGPQRAADPPAARATPTSPACRSTASTTPARCWSGPAPARPPPGWRSARSPQAFLRQAVGVEVVSHVVGHRPGRRCPTACCPARGDNPRIDEDPVRCADPATSERMVAEIDDVRKNGDTLGGVIEVVVHGLPPGLGSHVHWDRRLDSRLAGALMGVQSVKAVEVGDGLETARRRGSVAHDEIELADGRTAPRAAAHRPRRRHRGRHDQRRGAAGARRDEADLAPCRARWPPSTPPPASPPSPSTSAATPARCRAAAS